MYYSLPTGELVLEWATLTFVVMLPETLSTLPLVGSYLFTRVLQMFLQHSRFNALFANKQRSIT